MGEEIYIIGFIALGIAFVLGGSIMINKRKRIIQNGVEVEGIIFDYETDYSDNIKYPIIRFVTKEGLWVTKKSDYGFTFRLKKNKKVIVIYNPGSPEEFIYKTSFDVSRLSYLFLYVGIIILLVGIWFGYQYLTKAKN